jgi:serine phosphatase RsbU (regulator of sigma subunit)
LAALRTLLHSSHLAGPDRLPELAADAGALLGAEAVELYLVDYDQIFLVPLRPASDDTDDDAGALSVEGTVAGRAFTEVAQQVSAAGGRPLIWTPVLDGTERLGVIGHRFPAGVEVDARLRDACQDAAAVLAELVVTRALYGDAVERVRRREAMTVAAELQWRLLPPLTFVSPPVAVAGVVAPTHEVAGDSFDYAVNGDTVHVAIFDAMGHGLGATLLASVALGTLRNARRSRLGLDATVAAIEAALAGQFGRSAFVTGIIGELEISTGWWRWVTCGHPAALLLRGGRVVKELDSVIGPPLGLGLLPARAKVGAERLQPGDRLVLYTDGVVEARDEDGEFFTVERLTEFLTRQAADQRPLAETLRRLNLAILAHQQGALQDDATTVMVEWHTGQGERSVP